MFFYYYFKELCDIHQDFLNQLYKLPEKSTKLSNIFITHKDRFLVYGAYCSNLSVAGATLQDICDRQPEVYNKIEVNITKRTSCFLIHTK